MAKFRDSVPVVDAPAPGPAPIPRAVADDGADQHSRSIGDILADLRNLSAEQVDKALLYQREHGVRFGEAAVALGYVSTNDVLFALAQQFNYPYAPDSRANLSSELVAVNEPFSPRAEGFRALRSQLMMRLFVEGQPRYALAVVSPDAGDGKTYCAANLAITLAQLGGRTLLVDADMRGPRVHELFNLDNRAGLSSILAGRAEAKVLQQVACVPSLRILPVGTMPPNPVELVERPAFGLLMRELTSKFDHVIVDTPAACYGSDSAIIAARCGASLIVVRKGKGKVAALQSMGANLIDGPNRFASVVLNEF